MSTKSLQEKVEYSLSALENQKQEIQKSAELAKFAFETYREELLEAIRDDTEKSIRDTIGRNYNSWVKNYERVEKELKNFEHAIDRLKHFETLTETKLKRVEGEVNEIYSKVARLDLVVDRHEEKIKDIAEKLQDESRKGKEKEDAINAMQTELIKLRKEMRDLKYRGIGGKVRRGLVWIKDFS